MIGQTVQPFWLEKTNVFLKNKKERLTVEEKEHSLIGETTNLTLTTYEKDLAFFNQHLMLDEKDRFLTWHVGTKGINDRFILSLFVHETKKIISFDLKFQEKRSALYIETMNGESTFLEQKKLAFVLNWSDAFKKWIEECSPLRLQILLGETEITYDGLQGKSVFA